MTEKMKEKIEKTEIFEVTQQEAGIRLDFYLTQKLLGRFSRSQTQNMIRSAAIKVNDTDLKNPGYKIKKSDIIQAHLPILPKDSSPQPEKNIPLDILFTDKDVIVLNKPAGLVVHPGAGHSKGTLVNALISYFGKDLSSLGGPDRPGIVHRLDKDTSGIMLVARNNETHKKFLQAFASHEKREIGRMYLALVWGEPRPGSGKINAALAREKEGIRRIVANAHSKNARHAITHFRILEKFSLPKSEKAEATLVECQLETGRTHQIRVHMAHIGHPLIGDASYGKGFFSKIQKFPEPLKTLLASFHRQALHARSISFQHPCTLLPMKFEAPLPEDIQNLLNAFREYGISQQDTDKKDFS